MTWSTFFWVVVLTLAPTLELRASIPYALLVAGWPVMTAATVGILANTALAPVLWVFVDKVMHLFLRVPWIDRIWQAYATRKRAKLQRYIDRWGVLGLALFIGVPFPGTGVYSGCAAAYLLGVRFRDFVLASFLGCLLAGSVITAVVASGNQAFDFFYKGHATVEEVEPT